MPRLATTEEGVPDVTIIDDSTSLTSTPLRNRRKGLFHSIAHRLRTAAVATRAKRQDEVTEAGIEMVVDEHELYVRDRNIGKTPQNMSNNNLLRPALERQLSGASRGSVSVKVSSEMKPDRYILAQGNLHFYRNFAYEEVRRRNKFASFIIIL